MTIASRFLLLLIAGVSLSGCASNCSARRDLNSPVAPHYRINPDRNEVFGVPLSSSYSSIYRTFHITEFGKAKKEGDWYDFLVLKTATGVIARIDFQSSSSDDNSFVYSLSTDSELVADVHGIRIGSSYRDVSIAWPDGNFAYGVNDEAYVRYAANNGLVFEFDSNSLDSICFDENSICHPNNNMKVTRIIFYPNIGL